jgi:hypothetical protein
VCLYAAQSHRPLHGFIGGDLRRLLPVPLNVIGLKKFIYRKISADIEVINLSVEAFGITCEKWFVSGESNVFRLCRSECNCLRSSMIIYEHSGREKDF